jgi:mRNA-degrading endonuclease RelE of RelBE toxin-antitoxin system
MIVETSKRFEKEFLKLPTGLQKQIISILKDLKVVDNLVGFPNCKPITGFKRDFYRIRVSSHRIGLEIVDGGIKVIQILTVKSRGDIYKTFPPK